jgi:hypothetical protein
MISAVDSDPSSRQPQIRKTTITTKPFAGFAAESAQAGETFRILSSCIVTAENPRFYMFVNQIGDDFLAKAGTDGDSITQFLVVQRPNGEADVYTQYPKVIRGRVTRDVVAGEELRTGDIDISTIESYRLHGLTLSSDDVVICVMKVGWKYGLFFDASRQITEGDVWRRLGDLYRTLQIDRVLSNIQERIRQSERPHVITEGKTDWRHIEAARQRLGVDIPLSYPTTDDSLGDKALLQICERMSKFGPPYANKVIAIFDRDNPQVLSKLQTRGDINGYQAWGNNVYSLVIPTPPHRAAYKHISIEMLYSDADLATTTHGGKRLYFTNELNWEPLPDNTIRYVVIPAIESKELTKKPYSDAADLIYDSNGQQVGLSKAGFAKLVYEGEGSFGQLDASNFAPIFEIIKDILADTEGSASADATSGS